MRIGIFRLMFAMVLLGEMSVVGAFGQIASQKPGNDVWTKGQRVSLGFLKQFKLRSVNTAGNRLALTGRNKLGLSQESASALVRVPDYDTVPYWEDEFVFPGYDSNGIAQSVWSYRMIGSAPESGRSTLISAPIVPVTIVGSDEQGNIFRDPDTGTPIRQIVSPDILKNVLQSPFFESSTYTSGSGQFVDQMMRAQFWDRIHGGRKDENWDNGWHTLLVPNVKTTRVMKMPPGTLYYGLNSDNSCCAAILVEYQTFLSLLFPQTYPIDNSSLFGAVELAGDINTRDVTTFLANNVYFYQGDLSNCCIGAFHGYDYEPGTFRNGNRPRIYVYNFSPWETVGILFNGSGDINSMSHEMAELANDPFIDNFTPWWQSENAFTGDYPRCMNLLETGDVVENFYVTPQVYSVVTHGRTYHVQDEALFSWFAFESPSRAHLGAYSWPDESTLTTLSPLGLLPGCSNAP